MGKQEFLDRLRGALAGLPLEDIEERLTFYSEMIDDRMEDGLSEAEAVAQAGSVEEIAAEITGSIPLPKLVKERIRPKRRLAAWEVILLVLGSPIWVSLLIALFAVVLSLYIVLWALIVSLWAVDVALFASALGCAGAGVLLLVRGASLTGLALISASLVLAGLGIFLCFGCIGASKGAAALTARLTRKIKSLFVRKEAVK